MSPPQETMVGNPMTELTEKRPPIQSKNSKMRSLEIPQSAATFGAAVVATKWSRTASAPSATVIHSRARLAICIVS